MRFIVALLVAVLLLTASAFAASSPKHEQGSRETVLGYIWKYRSQPDPSGVPEAMRAASRFGALRDSETAGVFVGFMAGVLAANPRRADEIVGKTLPLPAEDQWFLVRAIAYSGLPHWKALLSRFAERMPARRAMIDRHLAGTLPVLDEFAVKDDPAWYERAWNYMRVDRWFEDKPEKKLELQITPDLIDTFWGYYFATGSYAPVARIIALAPWSKDRENAERLTIGSMAKYTLATNSARDSDLLRLLKWSATQAHPEATQKLLAEIIEAAETVETARLRKQMLAALEDLKRKGPYSRRHVAWWGQLGESAIALGCLGAAVTGQVEFGLPCVLGGAMTSAGLRWWATTD
jgi:hypothetical protein